MAMLPFAPRICCFAVADMLAVATAKTLPTVAKIAKIAVAGTLAADFAAIAATDFHSYSSKQLYQFLL